MKIAVVYNWVEKPSRSGYLPDDWTTVLARFVSSYRKFNAGEEHDLVICTSGASLSMGSRMVLGDLAYRTLEYSGGGWDIGAYQFCARKFRNYDWLVCLNSQIQIAQEGWLTRFANAFKSGGPGVYGASSSFEVAPHIRTSCIAFPPKLARAYPLIVRSRYDACVFEHSPKNFSLWALEHGYVANIVMQSGVYGLMESRNGDNIFRRGSQSDLLIRDRHTKIYDESGSDERSRLEALADGKNRQEFVFLNKMNQLLSRYPALHGVAKGLVYFRKTCSPRALFRYFG